MTFRRGNNYRRLRRNHVPGKQQLVVRLVKGQMTGGMAPRMEGLQVPFRTPVGAVPQSQPFSVLQGCVNGHLIDKSPGSRGMCEDRNSIPPDAALDGSD